MTRPELESLLAAFTGVRLVSVDESRPGVVLVNLRASAAEVRDVQSALDATPRHYGTPPLTARVDPEIAADRAARTPEAVAEREARAAAKEAARTAREAARAALDADPERVWQRYDKRVRAAAARGEPPPDPPAGERPARTRA